MRWKIQNQPESRLPEIGEHRIVQKFAILPTKVEGLEHKEWIWLEEYLDLEMYRNWYELTSYKQYNSWGWGSIERYSLEYRSRIEANLKTPEFKAALADYLKDIGRQSRD